MNLSFILCLDKTNRNLVISDTLPWGLSGFRARIEACAADSVGLEPVGRISMRFICFGDFFCDSEPLVESRIFDLDEDVEEMISFLKGVRQGGGGDLPEHSLEALTLGIRASLDPCADPTDRSLVLLLTDSVPHPLGAVDSDGYYMYPPNMPKSLDELKREWEDEHISRRRLALVAPKTPHWQAIEDLQNCYHLPITAGGCYCDLDDDVFFNFLAAVAIT